MKELLNRRITVRFLSTLDNSKQFHVPPCIGDGAGSQHKAGPVSQVRGTINQLHNEIWLNSVMIGEIAKGPAGSTQFGCGHRSLYRVALATLLHEVSHLYDFGNFRSEGELRKLRACDEFRMDPGFYPAVNNNECDLLAEKRTVSITPGYLALMGWEDEGWFRVKIRPRNQLRLRTPDPYEFQNIEENFAVNMEFFLLDPEFACRRPTVNEYLNEHFGWAPAFESPCKMNTEVQLTNGVTNVNQVRIADLDPSRVYGVHYLFASKSSAIMSRWGHAMYRIIVCNKLRTVVGPECLQDISDHVVVSFVANFGGLTINYWKGLTGGYPSQLDLQTFFPNIVNGYTLDEYRDLISLPLRLDEKEKRRFIYRVLEMHSEYAGRYYFFTNNCATEALSFLKGVVRTDRLYYHTNYTPVGLYEDLIKLGVVDASVVQDKAKAVDNGYYFKSKKDDLVRNFEKIRDAGITRRSRITFARALKNASPFIRES
jgi:hypothetical protein